MRHVNGEANRPASRRAPKSETDEPDRAGRHRADAEQPPFVAVFVGQCAEEHHGVEVDVRVEERQRQRRSRSTSTSRAGAVSDGVSDDGRQARRAASSP